MEIIVGYKSIIDETVYCEQSKVPEKSGPTVLPFQSSIIK